MIKSANQLQILTDVSTLLLQLARFLITSINKRQPLLVGGRGADWLHPGDDPAGWAFGWEFYAAASQECFGPGWVTRSTSVRNWTCESIRIINHC